MAKTKKHRKRSNKLLILLLSIIALSIYLLVHNFGWMRVGFGFLLITVLIIVFRVLKNNTRRSALMAKYRDEDLVKDIEQGYFWQGQTADQLFDALGKPDDIDERVLKTKIKSIWKYNHLGGNRYGLRIKLDNSVVMGWDQKD